MSPHITEAAFWCLVAGALVVLVLLIRQRQITATLRKQNTLLARSVGARDQEASHLADVRLAALADALHEPVPVPGLVDEQLAGTAFAHSLQTVMDRFAGAVEQAQSRADQSAKAALKASMRALQGLANEQQLSISDMQDRHDHPEVLQDLLEIDHANSQFGRRAQAVAVLCGSWPGRQRAASGLTDVVRGAKSRIRDYRRVQVHAQVDIAVVSRAVEPVVLAVAELLDNAARHSQPDTAVEVNLQPAHNGACVVIDDAGVGMDGHEVEQAAALLSGRRPVDVTRLGDPPQFGFPVIGVLAERYGFSVSVDTRSPYGGVRAVLFLPSALLTHLDTDGRVTGTVPLPPAARARHAPGPGPVVPAPVPPPVPRTQAQPGQDPPPRPRPRGRAPGPQAAHEARSAQHQSAPRQQPGPLQGQPHGGQRDPYRGRPPQAPAPGSAPQHARPPQDPYQPRPQYPGQQSAQQQRPQPPQPARHATRHRFPPQDGEHPSTRPHLAQPQGEPEPPQREPEAGPPAGRQSPAWPSSTAGGLPKRRRRERLADPGAEPAAGPEAPARPAEETARRMGAFARGTRSGRAADRHDDNEGNPQA